MLSKEAVDEFRQIFKEEYGAEYTDLEAEEAANNLMNFFKTLLEISKRLEREGKLKTGLDGKPVFLDKAKE